MTSRKLPDFSRLLRFLDGCEVAIVTIPTHDTMKDIELFVRNRVEDLPIDEEEEREDLARQILAKSDSSFLWVRLVMDELEGVYGYDSIVEILQGIPEGMFPYYGRIVADMGNKKREQHVAKAILRWVMLATRPLSLLELSHALQLDINVQLPSVKSAIEGLCGQLVSVDVHTGLVQPVHATAREFVLSEEAGEFRIFRTQGHETIALTCLQLLVAPYMQPPRHRRMVAQKRGNPANLALADYAITQFSEHVVSASTESDKLLLALGRFLKTTVLTWIERIMLRKDVHRLYRTTKNLKAYLNRRAKYHSPLNHQVTIIEAWATDLTRIVSGFGRALTKDPSSIYFLIPPLCPTQSAVYQQFGKSPDGLSLSGYCRSEWSDCVANVHFEEETAAAIGCGNNLIAIGTASGKLDLYNSRSFQKESSIALESPVNVVHVDPLGSFLAVSSRRFVGVWETGGIMRWIQRVRHRFMLLYSSQDILIGVTTQGRSFRWDLITGELLHEQSYVYQDPNPSSHSQSSGGKAPTAASFSPGLELIALNYRNSPVCIFECSTGNLIGWAIDDNSRAAEQLVFNPNPEVGLLLVAYNESHLALYDSWSGTVVETAEAENHVILDSVTCSLDGRTFATVDVRGHLRVWDFESLTLLYHVLTPAHTFSLLQFTSDGLGLVHVVDHEMRVWSPSALVRKTMEEEASLSDQSPVLPVTEGQFERFQASKISTLIAHPSWPIVFAGNYNGEVVIYQASSGYTSSVLYSHDGIIIRCLAASRHNFVASADLHNNVQLWSFDPSKPSSCQAESQSLKIHLTSPVTQLLFDTSGELLLVSTIRSAQVYNVNDGACIGSQDFKDNERWIWKWFVVSTGDYRDHFLLMADSRITAYSVKEFSNAPSIICENPNGFAKTIIETIAHIPETLDIVIETQDQPYTLSSIFTLPPWNLPPAELSGTAISSQQSALFLGVNQGSKRLILLQPDSWVCSVDMTELKLQRYINHFFVPEEYGALTSNVHPVQTVDGDFTFCMYDKVVVVKGGLKFETKMSVAGQADDWK